jgi:hypothetical protein
MNQHNMSSKKSFILVKELQATGATCQVKEIVHEQKLIDSWASCIELDKWNSDKIKIKISSHCIIANH